MQDFIFKLIQLMFAASLVCLTPGMAIAQTGAGTVSFVIGEANASTTASSDQAIRRGDQIVSGQTILTGANGHVHLKMIDGAFVSIRPMSRFRIEEYKYDAENPKDSRIKFTLESGTVRSITGKAGQSAKQSFRLNTPLAAIGIRGTDFVVQAGVDVTRVLVQSGAIVMTPLNKECLFAELGPCNSNAARVLTSAMRDAYLELRNRKEAPVLVPAAKSLNSPNSLSPPRPEEPAVDKANKTSSTSSSENGQDNAQSVAVATVKGHVDALVKDAKPPETGTDRPPQGPPPVALPPAPARIWWGRWAIAENEGRSFNSVNTSDREVTISNVVFGMLREKGEAFVPNSGVVKFSLAESESYLLNPDRSLTVANITDPKLTVDFGRKKFDTSLMVNVRGLAPTEIRASGEITTQGLFMTETTSADTILAGSLSKSADQAGFIFQRTTSGGLITGATRWVQ
ncbi:FecR family protein [Undibacterium flavidum]|uniref:FecR domain-containing protein n=1 Tax=Undibacterium flavidum TaxID=2762297 RepID=A0ABR6Y8V8_9BURK|nr:FecR family protein [Undibacterium flavidum]MBC3873056.1 FecR domain-containing protein [Undibacterium flavidum]